MKTRIIKFAGISHLFVLLALCTTGCEKAIDVKLPDYQPKLVIEGTIENERPAMVILSKSIPYFSEIDIDYLKDSVFITDANVTIASDNGETEQLTCQYCNDSPLYFAYVSNHLVGRENSSYTLTVEYAGNTYTATTTIPRAFKPDSIWFDNSLELLNDSMRTIRLLLTDDPAENNFYGFSVKVKSPKLQDRLWVHCMPIAFGDMAFNGLTFNYEITRAGVSAFLMPEMSPETQHEYYRMTFRPGDTVYVKHSLMDYNTYRFMITGGTDAVFGSNPFLNPAPVIGNIKGKDVLGCWCGFASTIDTLIWHTE